MVSSSIESEVPLVALQITSYGKSWVVRRSYEHFRLLDEQLHRCIYDRKFSQLPLLPENVNHPAEVNSSADRHTQNAVRVKEEEEEEERKERKEAAT